MKNVLPFLEKLSRNNDREWFQTNKDRYLQAKNEFETFVAELLPVLASIDKDVAGLEPSQCVFRIYRDVRFSPDKSPYKTNMGAAMGKGGRKSHYSSYYIHLEPGNSFAGGGIWMPQGPVLKAMRQEVFYNAAAFREILEGKDFSKYFDGLMGEKLKRPPRDFPVDFPDVELLKHKSYAVGTPLADSLITSNKLIAELEKIYAALYPFNRFINRALADI